MSGKPRSSAASAGTRVPSLIGVFMLAAAVWVLVIAASAQAAVVTVGSPLSAPFPFAGGFGMVTVTNLVLPEPGANVTSPVSGTIVRWRLSGASGGPFRLRVLTPGGGTTFTGAGTSEPRTPSGTATESFTTNLPISAGQQIGLDLSDASDSVGIQSSAGLGASYGFWGPPPLAQGETQTFLTGASDEELGFNADVATKSSNAFGFGSLSRNTKKGTATLAVNVPGPGTLELTGNGVKAASPGAVAATTVSAPGVVELPIRAKGKKRRRLNDSGKTKLNISVTYTPSGDLPGDPNTQSRRVKLLKRH
jgi:hypothetical protein